MMERKKTLKIELENLCEEFVTLSGIQLTPNK